MSDDEQWQVKKMMSDDVQFKILRISYMGQLNNFDEKVNKKEYLRVGIK